MISSASAAALVAAGPILQLHSAKNNNQPTSAAGLLACCGFGPTHVRCKNFMLNATSPPLPLSFFL